jgi:hypothetical protein
VLKFWRNPEFVRHLRSELRPTRAITVALVVLFLCALIGLACWSERHAMLESAERSAEQFDGRWSTYASSLRQDLSRRIALLTCQWLLALQGGLLTFWSLFACAQSISGERDRKTWDFQRTTSLMPGEIAIGKLLGEPVLAYFGTLCALPVTIWAGLAGGLSVWTLLSAYAGLFAGALFLGLCGLWLSTLLETRSRGIGLLGALVLYAAIMLAYELANSLFPGLAAFSPLTSLRAVLELTFDGRGMVYPTLFGHVISWFMMGLLLYASFGAWLSLMLVRNLKRDFAEIRPLSRWQAVGCVAFLNFVFYALLTTSEHSLKSSDVATFMVEINGAILFAIGLATLTPPERLRVWWRERLEGSDSIFSENGLPWPWLAASAIVAYAFLIWGLMAWRTSLDFSSDALRTAGFQLLVVLIYITRDILFVQWCTLTRLRQPVLKGFLFLCLYYIAAMVVVAMGAISGQNSALAALNVLTPAGVFDPHFNWANSTSLYLGSHCRPGALC